MFFHSILLLIPYIDCGLFDSLWLNVDWALCLRIGKGGLLVRGVMAKGNGCGRIAAGRGISAVQGSMDTH